MHELHAGHHIDQFADQMRRGGSARRAEVKLLRLRFREGNQLLQIVDAEGRMGDQHVGHRADEGDRREVLGDVEA